MWITARKVLRVGPLTSSGTHILSPCSSDPQHGTTGLNVYPAGFWSCLHLILFCLSPPFWNGNVTHVIVPWNYVTCFIIFAGVQS